MSARNRRDLYETLGVPRDADQAEIKKAHRAEVKRTHPDRAGGDREQFEAAQKAWLILGDPEKRKRYDETGECDAAQAKSVPQAVQVLAACWEEVLGQCEPCQDLIQALKTALEIGAAQAEVQMKDAREAQAKWEMMLKRLRVDADSPASVLAQSIDDKAKAAARQADEFTAILAAMKDAAGLLGGASYKVPPSEKAAGKEADRKQMLEMLEQMMGSGAGRAKGNRRGHGGDPRDPHGIATTPGRAECRNCGLQYKFIRGKSGVSCPRCRCPEAMDLDERRYVDFDRVQEQRQAPQGNFDPGYGYGSGPQNFPGGGYT